MVDRLQGFDRGERGCHSHSSPSRYPAIASRGGRQCRSPRRRRSGFGGAWGRGGRAEARRDRQWPGVRGERERSDRTMVAEGTSRPCPWLAVTGIETGANRRFDQLATCRSKRMTRVLLADDHPMIASALEMLLRDTDYELVGRARSGKDALAQ